jgi:hypothetical protein
MEERETKIKDNNHSNNCIKDDFFMPSDIFAVTMLC